MLNDKIERRYSVEITGKILGESWVDLTQRAHLVPKSRTAYYVVELGYALASELAQLAS